MSVTVITPPAAVVDLETLKAHLRVDHSDDDAIIAAYGAAVTAHIDGPAGWLGRSIGVQTLRLIAPRFPHHDCHLPSRAAGEHRGFLLPYGPVREIVSVKYLDRAEVEQTLDPSVYRFLAEEGLVSRATLASWPQDVACLRDAVRITYKAGYDVAPSPIQAAILLMAGDLYSNRETSGEGRLGAIPMSTTVEALLSPFRAWSL